MLARHNARDEWSSFDLQVELNDRDDEEAGNLVANPADTLDGPTTFTFVSTVDDYRYRAQGGDLDELSPFTFSMFYRKIKRSDIKSTILTHHRYDFMPAHAEAKSHTCIRKINFTLPRAIRATPSRPAAHEDAGLLEEYAAFVLGNFASDRSNSLHEAQQHDLIIQQLAHWELSTASCDQANRHFAANMSSLSGALALAGKLAKQRRAAGQNEPGTICPDAPTHVIASSIHSST